MLKTKKNTICFGFDVSSSTVGICSLYVCNKKITKVEYSYYKPKNKNETELGNIFKLYDYIFNYISEQQKKYKNVEYKVFVEDFIMFMPGKSSARTITLLSVYNRTVCLAANHCLNIEPELLPVATIRSVLKKVSGNLDRVDKEHVPEVLEKIIKDHLPDWNFRWSVNKKGVPIDECYDQADGIAAAVSGSFRSGILEHEKIRSI